MNNPSASSRQEVKDFLTSRRARITPQQAGLPAWGGGSRRVPGLRREEVAMLAGVSVDYYTRLERGNLAGVSESVLTALANALQLDEAERGHLENLARTANRGRQNIRRTPAPRVRPQVEWMLQAMRGTPALVMSTRSDILAGNDLGRALYAPVFDFGSPANTARFIFLDPRAQSFYPDWEQISAQSAANLRTQVGQNPYDKALHDVVGELTTRSERFAQLWAAHNVRLHRAGDKRINHPVVGLMTLHFESLLLSADEGLALVTYVAEPGSESARSLELLASWTAPSEPLGLLHG